MLNKLKQIFSNSLSLDAVDMAATDLPSRKLAAVALMVEIIAVDYQQKDEEKQALLALLQRQFDVNETDAAELVKAAEQARQQATDFYRFTAEINRSYSAQQKIDLIETLWQLAWADSEIHQLEEHVIRRLANLLHISHKDFIATKLRVIES